MNLTRMLPVSLFLLFVAGCDSDKPGGYVPEAPVTAVDTTPDSFTLVDVDKAPTNVLITSAPVVITGIEASTEVSIEGGSYSINGGAFVSAAGSVAANDEVRVQLLSSATLGATTSATLTVGGVSDSFDVHAREEETAPNAVVLFPAVQDSWVYQSQLIIRGTATDNMAIAGVYVNDVLASTGDDFANWQLQVSVAEPHSEFTVRVVDTSDNEVVLEPIRVNAHPGFGVRASRGLALDVEGQRMFAGPRPTKIAMTDFSFTQLAEPEQTIWGMAFDDSRDKWYANTDAHLLELSTETGEVLAEYPAEMEYANRVAVDDSSGTIFWNNLKDIRMLDPATGVADYVSGALKGTGVELGYDALVVVNGGHPYVLSEVDTGTSYAVSVIGVDLTTGDRTVLINLEESAEAITSIVAVDSHPSQPLLYFLGGSALDVDAVENLYRLNLDTGDIDKLFDGSTLAAEELGADFRWASLAVDHSNNTAYVLSDSADHLFHIDLTSGDIERLTSDFRGTGPTITGDHGILPLVFDESSGQLLTSSSSVWSDLGGKILRVDVETGERATISGPERGVGGEFDRVFDLSATAGGEIYVADYRNNAIKLVSAETGDRLTVADAGTGCCTDIARPSKIAVDSSGLTAVLLVDWQQLVVVDLTTGNREVVATVIGPVGPGPDWAVLRSIAVDFEGGVIYVYAWLDSGEAGLFAVNLASGERELLVSGERGVAMPETYSIFHDSVRGTILFPSDYSRTSYVEYQLSSGELVEKPFLGGEGVGVGSFAKAGNRLFASLTNPNRIAEIDEETGSLVIISQ